MAVPPTGASGRCGRSPPSLEAQSHLNERGKRYADAAIARMLASWGRIALATINSASTRAPSPALAPQPKPPPVWHPKVCSASVHAFDDTDVAFARIAERGQCLLVGGAAVNGNGLFNTVELDRNGALCDALLIGLDGAAARKKAAAIARYRPARLAYAASAAGSEIER
jgi:hypothetical protein